MEYALTLLFPILGGLLLGMWLTSRFGLPPIWTVIFAILGMIGGIGIMYKRYSYPELYGGKPFGSVKPMRTHVPKTSRDTKTDEDAGAFGLDGVVNEPDEDSYESLPPPKPIETSNTGPLSYRDVYKMLDDDEYKHKNDDEKPLL